MKCWKVLLRDADDLHWWPYFMAEDEHAVAQKVAVVYPRSIIEDIKLVHESHTQWAIVYPDPVVDGFAAGSTFWDRRAH